MNGSLPDNHPSIRYYDGDYPSRDLTPFPENIDDVVPLQGLFDDVQRYLGLALEHGSVALELCCGSGRVAIPLARRGVAVTAVDISHGMLELFCERLKREDTATAGRVTLVQQDITILSLERRDFPLIIVPFNSLLCIPDFRDQCAALNALAGHLAPGGRVALDLMNPLTLPLQGDPPPKPFFTRRRPDTGNIYTRFAAMSPIDLGQRQRLYGWYDELSPDGTVKREHYSMEWRPIFRFELELMLERAGLQIESIEGGHLREPFVAGSRKMFVIARAAG